MLDFNVLFVYKQHHIDVQTSYIMLILNIKSFCIRNVMKTALQLRPNNFVTLCNACMCM